MSIKDTHTRYPFAPISGREGAFFFPDDFGCYYTVEISKAAGRFNKEDLLNNNGEIYEISFESSCEDERTGKDKAVSNTIIYIIGSSIASKGDTPVYFFVCDDSDNRGKARSKLFERWYLELHKSMPALQKHDFMVSGNNDDEYHISLFISSNHPFNADYIQRFEKNLSENFAKN